MRKPEGPNNGFSLANVPLDSSSYVCGILAVGWKQSSLARPDCHFRVSGCWFGVSSRGYVHHQATAQKETRLTNVDAWGMNRGDVSVGNSRRTYAFASKSRNCGSAILDF